MDEMLEEIDEMRRMPEDPMRLIKKQTLQMLEREREYPEWAAYEKEHLEEVDIYEGLKIVLQAQEEADFNFVVAYKQLRLKRLIRGTKKGSAKEKKLVAEFEALGPDVTNQAEEMFQALTDRVWEAGYVSVGGVAHFKVKPGAPYPPEGDVYAYRQIPRAGLIAGSRPFKAKARARGGKRAAPSQYEERPLHSTATGWAIAHSFTAMQQRGGWDLVEQGALKVERGYPVSLKSEKVHIVYFLGELEFEDDLHPQPFGAAQTTEILKRWGLLHSFLHAGLCVALSESNGRGVELGEKDLLYISGLKTAFEKGHIKKAVAIERIRAALKDLGTLSAAVRSTDRRIETDRQPLFINQPVVISADGEAKSIAAHIAPGHWLKRFFGPDRPHYDIPRELFTLPAGLPSWLGIWLTANVWRFDKGRRVPLRKVLEGIIPQVKPENAEEWEGHSITWAELEPEERTPQTAARMKKCRETLREQLPRIESILTAHNIAFKIHGNKRTGTTWEEFLDSPTSLSIVGIESRRPLLDRVLDTVEPEKKLTGETIKAALKAAGMKQGELAKLLGVSAVMVTYWLKPADDPKAKAITPEYTAKIRELLRLEN
ncbi:helix-turn-helix domain-containing protein [Deinococcus fonticola]|uniref:helix-turn-helix domain-containing protein n=1 Tax=Deinococcus fonticola TaxID=2528713 RepID=UPI0010756281|nr:helix-turn-helix transcriptional regulator [Deinococcus fonticola]